MITFPRDMPSVGALGQWFELDRVDYLSPEAGGRLGAVTAGQPLWKMAVGLQNMVPDDADIWRAWIPVQRGAGRLFYGRDLDRPYPKAYRGGFAGMTRAGGGAFDGAATSWSEALDSENNSRVTLNGLPANFALGLGDYIGFRWDDAEYPGGNLKRRAMVRVVDAATGSAGGVLTVTSEPAVPLVVPVGAVAYLNVPVCLMRLVTAETLLAEQGLMAFTSAGGKIVGLQDLRE
ncbi:MAG TPA: hypothetical protein VMS43_13915 [Allosphingosinicella sp.]|nr:hypothetical protein [Allosphingosinicella sp.]